MSSIEQIYESLPERNNDVLDYIQSNTGLTLKDVLYKQKEEALSKVSAIRVNKAPKAKSVKPNADETTIIDKDWVSSRFMVPDKDLASLDRINRYYTTTGWKYTSTMLGSNFAINARPQFTRFADIKGNNPNAFTANITSNMPNASGGIAKARASLFERVTVPMMQYKHDHSAPVALVTKGIGMGRYYSEAIDDNATLVFMQFGVPRFNSLINFFTRAISYEDSYIANYGRYPVGYAIGKFVGAYGMLCAFPLITTTIWAAKGALDFVFGGPYDYYYLEPAMHVYWSTVSSIVTFMTTELGLISPILKSNTVKQSSKIGAPITINAEDLEQIAKMLPPGMVSPITGYIDVFAIATRTQALANAQTKAEYNAYKADEKAANSDFIGQVSNYLTDSVKRVPGKGLFSYLNNFLLLENYKDSDTSTPASSDPSVNSDMPDDLTPGSLLERTRKNSLYEPMDDINAGTTDGEPKPKEDPTDNSTDKNRNSMAEDGTYKALPEVDEKEAASWLDKLRSGFDSVTRNGGDWAVFAVDYQGSVSESFSSSYSDIETQGMIKSTSQAARNIKFQFAGGNFAGEAVKEIAGAFKNVLMGVADSVSFGLSNVIATILGGAYTSIPKKWDDSEMSLPTISYKISLVSPYGNVISQMQNIYIPLAMLLAGALPLATGRSSYTSPFLCSIFNKGVQNIKLGMITSLSITRGTNNLGFTRNKIPLGIDVDFTVTDFSTVISAPVNSSIFKNFNVSLDDNTPFGNYIGVLCSRDLLTQKYFRPKALIKASRLLMAGSRTISPAAWGMLFGHKAEPIVGLFTDERKLIGTQNSNIFFW